MGRYGASEIMRDKNLQKKAVDCGMKKLTPFVYDTAGKALDQLSTKVRPNKKYKTDRKDLDGSGIIDSLLTSGVKGSPWQVDLKKGINLITDPELWAPVNKMPVADAKKLVQCYKDSYKQAKKNGYTKSYNSFVKEMGWGKGIDIHKWIGKLPRPKAGWTPGNYKYMGAYNPLDKQLEYDPQTGEVLRWHVMPYNKVDEVSAYHDICYDMGKDEGECDREMIKSLDQIPYGERSKWRSTARFLITTKQKLGLGVNSKKREAALSDWSQQLAEELHKPITRNVRKRTVISYGVDKIWAADLVEMQTYSKWNKDIKYLLMVIDIFSKYGWIVPLKDKKTDSVSLAFDLIFKKSKRKPEKLWTDKGSEFISKHFKDFLKRHNITLYHTQNEEKSSVVERWNRTIKNKMWKMFSANNNTVYWDKLDKLVDDYNNRKHSSIKMSPSEVSKKENEKQVLTNLYEDEIFLKPEKPKFSIGDKVRISKYKRRVFDKGYTPNWTEEVFVVDKVVLTKPVTYNVVDILGEKVEGSFYEKELQKAKQQTFRIEKVVKRDYKKKKALVKWKGYSDKFNSWVNLVDF